MTDPIMPYMVTKTATFSVFDSRYSGGTVTQRMRLHKWLRDDSKHPGGTDGRPSGHGAAQATLRTPALDAVPTPPNGATTSGDERLFHINAHWCGLEPRTSNRNALPWTPAWMGKETTGVWNNWKGDAAKILQEGYARAVEASLGIGPTDDPKKMADVDRFWDIDFLWTCPHPRFEVWVTWRALDGFATNKRRGKVTVLLCTPGITGSGIEATITRTGAAADEADYRDDTRAPGDPKLLGPPYGEQGMWVIGHQTTDAVQSPTSSPSEQGKWKQVAPATVRDGSGSAVVVVQPSEIDGGVLSNGREWIPVPSN